MLDTSTYFDYNQDDYMSLSYNSNNNLIDDHPSMSRKSDVLSDSACPTNIISFRNQHNEYSSTQQTERRQGMHIEEKIKKGYTCDQCFTHKNNLNKHERLHTSKKP